MRPLPLLSLLGIGLLLTTQPACRRKSTVPPPPVPAEQPAAPAESAPASTAPAVDRLPTAPPNSSLQLPVQKELTGALHLYQMDHHKLPVDFQTLVKDKYVKGLPSPPPGKHLALDRSRMQVVFAD